MKESGGKILVIRGGAIGDFILTLPVLTALKKQFESATIDLLGYPHIAGLALLGGLATSVRPIEAGPLAGFFAKNGNLAHDWRRFFVQYNVIISYLYDPDRIFEENIRKCIPERSLYIAGPHKPNLLQKEHATHTYLKPLEKLAVYSPDPTPRIFFEPQDKFQLPHRVWLAVHPGSGSEKKNWPENNWNDLLLELCKFESINFLIVGGEAEGDRLDHLTAVLPHERFKLLRSQPLPEVAQWLRSCTAFVGHDSGVSHLAAAVGLPSIILWPDTPEHIWHPMGDSVKVLRNPSGINALPRERVRETVIDMLLELV
ncbi:MAG: glycosyltransferase family 9 protein [Verrucomicrobia bacterium]|nr:glycosyltransferase family 9 protein [Verrucomicrobiota bacterium]MCF7707960.1 glycosyltransferase family 9 protein [Verrucomicrobiota bacterium]